MWSLVCYGESIECRVGLSGPASNFPIRPALLAKRLQPVKLVKGLFFQEEKVTKASDIGWTPLSLV